MYVMAIDLLTVGLEFLVTPSKIPDGILCTRTTSKFLEEFSMNVAINGDGYSYLDASVNPATTCPNGGDPVKVNGLRGFAWNCVFADQNHPADRLY